MRGTPLEGYPQLWFVLDPNELSETLAIILSECWTGPPCNVYVYLCVYLSIYPCMYMSV